MKKQDSWIIEIVKKLPWSATFLVAAYFLFKDTDSDLAAWICIVIAIIALFLVIRFEYYERIIDRQEKQIKQYSKQAIDVQIDASKTISDMNTSVASSLSNYKKEINTQTETI